MPVSLIHYGNSKVVLNGREYSWDDFLKVCGDYSVPFGFHTRVYEQGVRHYVTDGDNTVYLKKQDAGCDRWCAREPELALLVERLKAENGD